MTPATKLSPITFSPTRPGTPFGLIGQAGRVPAHDVRHVYDQLFPLQMRGMSWLAPILLKLSDFDAASGAMLMMLKVQGLMTGVVRGAKGGTAGFEPTDGSLNVSLEPSPIRVLPYGAEVEFSQPGQGLSQAAEFVKGQQREITIGVGRTNEQMTGDLSGIN